MGGFETSTIPVCKHPIDIAINPLDNRALVVCDEDRSLLLIDLNTPPPSPSPLEGEGWVGGKVVKTYPLNKLPKGVAVNNFTNIAGVVDDKTDSLTLIQLPNPISQITSINPDTLLRGSKSTTITIEGSGFIRSSSLSIQPSAVSLQTLFTDNHHLEITIPESLLTKVGTYQMTVTNPSPEGGTSSPINLQINNPVPSIAMLDPSQTMAGASGLTVTVYGSGFFDDTTVYVSGIPRPFTLLSQTKLQIELTASDLEVGAYLQVAASNPPPGGGLSNKAVFTVLNPVPSLSSISPTTIIAGSPDFTLSLTGNNFVKTSIISFNNQQYPARYISKTQLETTIPSNAINTPGSYPVKVINPAPGGGESLALTFTVKLPLEIKIISPSDGETINKAKIMVKGTVKSDTSDVGIIVNGIIADVIPEVSNRGTRDWIANNIPLTIGTNTITATAKDSYGNTDTKTITIYTNDTTQQVELSANITSGIAPLTVFFSTLTSFTPVSYQIDFEGDGVIDYAGATFEDISFTYNAEGIFFPTLTVTDDQGNTYSDTIAITVLSKSEIDALLKGKWEEMKGALFNKDIEDGLNYFLEHSRERYRQAFNIIVNELPQIISDMQNIEMIYLKNNVAKYRINRVHDINGTLQTLTYYIYLVKDADGIWKIDRF